MALIPGSDFLGLGLVSKLQVGDRLEGLRRRSGMPSQSWMGIWRPSR